VSQSEDEFPVEPPEEDTPKRKGSFPKTPEAKAAWQAKMQEARQRKKAERERAGSRTGSGAATTTAGSRSVPTATTRELAEIETSIVEGLTKLGAAATPVLPIPGVYTIRTAEDIGGILTRLASRNPAILKALSSSSNVMDYVGLGVWALGMYYAVQVQVGRIEADSPAAQNFGLTEIAVEFYGERLYAEPEPEAAGVVEGSGSAFDPFAVPVPPDVADAEARISA
jgi:hypothetical protein